MRLAVAVAVAMALAACGGPRAEPAARAPAAAPARCDPATPTLTIITDLLPPGCTGGVFLIDGVERGRYPVRCAPAPEGAHVVGVESAGDCAGMGDFDVVFVAGRERVIDLRTWRVR